MKVMRLQLLSDRVFDQVERDEIILITTKIVLSVQRVLHTAAAAHKKGMQKHIIYTIQEYQDT